MKKTLIIILKVLLITFIGNILIKHIIPSLGALNPIVSALLTPILTGILIYFLFFRKTKPEIINNTDSQKTSKNKKNIIITIVSVIALGLLFFAVQDFYLKKPSFDKVMVELANELNKSCPVMVDQDIRLDNVMAMLNNEFVYNYTLVNIEKQNIDINEIKDLIEPSIVNNMKFSPDMKLYRENRTTLTCNFKDKNGVFILQINVTPDKYE